MRNATTPAPTPYTEERLSVDLTIEGAWSAWHEYYAIVQALDSDLRLAARPYLQTFSHSDKRKPPLASHFPVVLAEAFQIELGDLTHTAAVANLCIDHFTQLLDDIADSPGTAVGVASHLSHCLLVEGLSRYLMTARRRETLELRLRGYLDEAMRAERAVWSHKGTIRDFDDDDFHMIALRGSLAKCNAAFFADATGDVTVLVEVERAIESLSLGIQLLDDLLDWQDDLRNRIYTYPIVLAFAEHAIGPEDPLLEQKVEASMESPPIARRLISMATSKLRDASERFSRVGSHVLAALIDQWVTSLTGILNVLSESSCDNAPAPGQRRLRELLDRRLQH